MIKIETKGLDSVAAALLGVQKQMRFAAKNALNNVAFAVNAEIKKEMSEKFKGGATAYSLRAFRVEKATTANLTATIRLRTDTPEGGTSYAKALRHIFTGGNRNWKKVEGLFRGFGLLPQNLSVAPGDACPLDRYGNITKGALKEIIAVVRSKIRNIRIYRMTGGGKNLKGIGYFVVLPGDKTKLHPGIWRRIETGSTSVVKPMIMYVHKGRYREIIRLDDLGNRVVKTRWDIEFTKEFSNAMRSAK